MLLAPSRPDWRWARATTLSEYGQSELAWRLPREDAFVRLAVQFLTAPGPIREDLVPEVAAAAELIVNRPHERAHLEGLILAGADNPKIMEYMEIPAQVIDMYSALFFDVRGRKPSTVASMVFQGFAHKGTHPGDRLGIAHRIAWMGGVQIFERFITNGLMPDETRNLLKQFNIDVMLKNTAELIMTAGARGDQAVEFVKLSLDVEREEQEAKAEKAALAAASAGPGEETLEAALSNFTSGLAISVADPTLEANLTMPKAEKRVAHYEQPLLHAGQP